MILKTDKSGGIIKYDPIDKRTLKDTRVLQPEDLGVLCYLLSNKDTYNFNIQRVVNNTKWGISKVSTAFKNLEKSGYLYKKRIFGGKPKHFLGYAYILKESRFDERNFEDYILDENYIYNETNGDDEPFDGFI